MSEPNIFGLGMLTGIIILIACTWAMHMTPWDAYNNGARDALEGRLRPITIIEHSDTTVTYKVQWP